MYDISRTLAENGELTAPKRRDADFTGDLQCTPVRTVASRLDSSLKVS
jgi:hypothetical protein